jgi:hypothetical protein
MKPWIVVAAIISLAPVSGLQAQEDYEYGRVRYTEPSVILQRAAEAETEEAPVNAPLLPGDRLWTDGAGRLEAQYEDGSVLWVGERTKVDYASQEASDGGNATVLRLWAGRLALRVRGRSGAGFAIETPIASVSVDRAAFIRLNVDPRTTRVALVTGDAVLETSSHQVTLDPGTEAVISAGGEDLEIQDIDRWTGDDDFAAWVEQRDEQETAWASSNQDYLPAELQPYAGELDANGTWYYEPQVGHVWHPHVDDAWQPYSSGRWVWTYYGWTWVPYEPWGWAPSHFGTWDYSVAIGWYWVPGRVWGPAWVSWSIGPGHVGWCPLNRNHRPVAIVHRDRNRRPSGHATPRGDMDPWISVAKGDFQRPLVVRHRTRTGTAQRIADAASDQPTRNLVELARRPSPPAVAAAVRASSAKSPGIFERRAGIQRSPAAARSLVGPAVTRERGHAAPVQSPPARSVFRPVERQQQATAPRPRSIETQLRPPVRKQAGDEGRKDAGAAAAPPAATRHSGSNPVRDLFRSIGRRSAEPRDSKGDGARNDRPTSAAKPIDSAARSERGAADRKSQAAPRAGGQSSLRPAKQSHEAAKPAPKENGKAATRKGNGTPKNANEAAKRHQR